MVSKNSEASTAGTDEASNLSTNFEVIDMSSIATQIATINVPFHGANLYIVNHNGEAQTPMRPIVEGMGLDWASQFTKIKNRFKTSVVIITTQLPGDAQRREVVCLPLRKVAGWLHTINVGKVRLELREKVARYQEECDDVLYEYWTNGQVTNPRKVKKTAAGKITADQQEAIKQLVLNRGHALPKENQAKAIITMWSSLKSHFGCSYKEIGEEKFTEALSLAARVPLEGELIERPNNCLMPDTVGMTGSVIMQFMNGRMIAARQCDSTVMVCEPSRIPDFINTYMFSNQQLAAIAMVAIQRLDQMVVKPNIA